MASPLKELLSEPRTYLLGNLIDDLDTPSNNRRSFERSLSAIMRDHGHITSRPGAVMLPNAQFIRDLGMATGSSGGDLAFGSLAAVADASRPQNALTIAGTPTIEVGPAASVIFPRWVKESTLGSWIAEGGTASTPDLTVASVTATPRSAYAAIRISRRLRVQTSFDIEQSLLRELSAATRAVAEDGFINGTGSASAPLGLLNVPGASASSWAGAAPTRAELIAILQDYAQAYGRLDQARWLLNSNLLAAMLASEVASSTGVFNLVMEGSQPTILGVPAVLSEQMPDSKLLLINPQTLRIVYWGGVAVQIDRLTYALQGDSVMLAYSDADIVSLQPAQICIGTAAA